MSANSWAKLRIEAIATIHNCYLLVFYYSVFVSVGPLVSVMILTLGGNYWQGLTIPSSVETPMIQWNTNICNFIP